MSISPTATLFFDCDGVILKSNKIKSDAFYEVSRGYAADDIAHNFLDYHQKNGGVSRDKKFSYLFRDLLAKDNPEPLIKKAMDAYQKLIFDRLLSCDMVDGVLDFIQKLPNKKYVVSGGRQDELREVFNIRKLDKYFAGIYGSPMDKYQLIDPLPEAKSPCVFFGDSLMDYQVAHHFNMDFFFVYGVTELSNYQEILELKMANNKPIQFIKDFTEIL